MTRDDIISVALEAGIERCTCKSTTCDMLHSVTTFDHLGRFASLVAAAERERCAEVCDEYKDWCQSWGQYDHHFAANKAADECAAKIRGME